MGTSVSREDYFNKGYYTHWIVMDTPGRAKVMDILDITDKEYENYIDTYLWNEPLLPHPITRWCDEHLRGMYTITHRFINFERKDDAMLFKMVWK